MKPHFKILQSYTVPSQAQLILLKSKDATKMIFKRIQYGGLRKVYLRQTYH